MQKAVERVLAIAEAEIGYLEKASAKQLDDKTANAGDKNYTKYARDLDAINFYNGKKQGFAWCDVFVDWPFVQAFGLEIAAKMTFQTPGKGNCGAGCKYSRKYYERNGHLFSTPEPGDQIFFWPKDRSDPTAVCHTGLVSKVDKNYVYTIEGNTSSGSSVVANGGAVCAKKYALSNQRIAGYGRPDWSIVEGVEVTETVKTPTALRKGDKGAAVKEMQERLLLAGCALPKYGADGDYGNETMAAVKAFQTAAGVEADGIYEPETHEALLQVLAANQGDNAPP